MSLPFYTFHLERSVIKIVEKPNLLYFGHHYEEKQQPKQKKEQEDPFHKI